MLALNEKVAAIREYEKMPVYKRIGRMFHCSPDQIKRIIQQKANILKEWEQRTRRSQEAKKLMKVVRVSMLGKAVYDWIRRMMYYKDFIITDGLIQKMALQFKSAMGLQNFFPHQDWCDKFRQTYKITSNDSKDLDIAYTQGHSVQIKDIVKDVLSECTPDTLPEISDDENDEVVKLKIDENKNAVVCKTEKEESATNTNVCSNTNANANSGSGGGGNSNVLNNTSGANIMNLRNLTQLTPLHQLVALPIQGNAVGMGQKVLVATPINTLANPRANGNAPMTMTIIPFSTISKPSATVTSHSPSAKASDEPNSNETTTTKTTAATTAASANICEKPVIHSPMPEIKQEIKTEPLDAIDIKQEYISDDDDEQLSNISPDSNNEDISIKSPTSSYNYTNSSLLSSSALSSTICSDDAETIDDDLPLNNLRKIMLQSQKPTHAADADADAETNNASKSKRTANALTTTTDSKSNNQVLTPTTPAAPKGSTNKRKHTDNTENALPPIKTCAEARRYLKLLEDFALVRENFRLIGLVTRADEVLRELDGNEDVDID